MSMFNQFKKFEEWAKINEINLTIADIRNIWWECWENGYQTAWNNSKNKCDNCVYNYVKK